MATEAIRPQTDSVQNPATATRRYELDWLRAFVVLGLIPIHAAVIFSTTADIYIKNTETSTLMALLGVFVGAWGMPLLFLVAGAGAYFALNHRTGGQYLRERVMRLLVPLAFASLVIVPVQVYAVAVANPGAIQAFNIPIHDPNFTSSYLAFYPEYLRGYGYFLTHFSPALAIIFWGHLWFIPRLFAYAAVSLPLFLYLNTPAGKRWLTRLGKLLSYPGAIFLMALPLAVVEMALRPGWLNNLTAHWPIYDDWVQFAFYLVYFIYGYLLYATPNAGRAITRHGWIALVIGLLGIALALTQADTLTTNPLNYSLGYILGVPIRSLVGWAWVIAILSFSMRRLTTSNKALQWLNDSAYPIYVLHMPVVTVVGLYIISLDLALAAKFVLIIAIALAITLALVEFPVRRISAVRVLFGLKRQSARHRDTPSTGAPTPTAGYGALGSSEG